jgi:hypothetical protein
MSESTWLLLFCQDILLIFVRSHRLYYFIALSLRGFVVSTCRYEGIRSSPLGSLSSMTVVAAYLGCLRLLLDISLYSSHSKH